MKTELSRTLCWEWSNTNRRQIELAPSLGLDQGVLSNYISGRRYPDDAGLRALCTRWPDPRGGLRILIAHLHDRINAAGRPGEVDVSPRDHTALPVRHQVESDLATLRTEAYRADYDDVRALLHDLAELIRRSTPAVGQLSTASQPVALAAESTDGGVSPRPARVKPLVYPNGRRTKKT
jgi:hypothetical protein